jgi:hypothetical protein
MSENDSRAYYRFVAQNAFRGIIWLAVIVVLYVLARLYIPAEWLSWTAPLTGNPPLMFFVFFLSETLFGLIPMELFIFWAKEQMHGPGGFSGYVLAFSCLSFLGGLVAYFAGVWAHRIPLLKRLSHLESFHTYATLYRRWGGVIIVIAALTPLPYATISFLSATFRFPLPHYLLYASTRFIRFFLVGWGTWYSTDLWHLFQRSTTAVLTDWAPTIIIAVGMG